MKYLLSSLFLFCFYCLDAQITYLDSTFGTGGKLVIPVSAYPSGSIREAIKIIVQPDGRILILTYAWDYRNEYKKLLLRTDQYGKLDTAFNTKSNSSITQVLVDAICQKDGKIVLCTRVTISKFQYATIQRLNQDGSPDTVFNNLAIPFRYGYGDALSLALQEDGKIILSGGAGGFHVRRYLPSGTIDSAFGTNGETYINCSCSWTYYGRANTIQILNDKKITLIEGGFCVMDPVGYGGVQFFIARVDSNGKPDSVFNHAKTSYPIIQSEAMPGTVINKSIYVTSLLSRDVSSNNRDTMLSFTKYTGDGKLKSQYDSINMHFSPTSIIAQNDKLLFGGYSDSGTFEIARYDTLGKPDSTFNMTGIVTTRFTSSSRDIAYCMAMQPDGKIILGGFSDTSIAIARYTNSSIITGTINFSQQKQKPLIFPNPIHDEAMLQYTLEKEERISINVYDINGRIVKKILNNQVQTSRTSKFANV